MERKEEDVGVVLKRTSLPSDMTMMMRSRLVGALSEEDLDMGCLLCARAGMDQQQ